VHVCDHKERSRSVRRAAAQPPGHLHCHWAPRRRCIQFGDRRGADEGTVGTREPSAPRFARAGTGMLAARPNVLSRDVNAARIVARGQAKEGPNAGSRERAFSADGSVKMGPLAGHYRISCAPEGRVRIRWSVRDPESLAKVQARADVHDRQLSITTNGPSNNNLRFSIEVPTQSDLYVRLSAGDLTIEGVRGNKDVELRAGDLRIDVGR